MNVLQQITHSKLISRVLTHTKHFKFLNHTTTRSIIPPTYLRTHAHKITPYQIKNNNTHPFSQYNLRIHSTLLYTHFQRRYYSTNNDSSNKSDKQDKQDKTNDIKSRNLSVSLWVSAILVATFGLAYAAIPLYRMFCRATGYGGTVQVEDEKSKKGQLILGKDGKPKEFRQIKVHLNSIVGDNLEWSFKPMQTPVYAIPNEPVLVFYEATNQSDTPVIGVATYNVVPQQAGLYFVKIQCFCFDEQRLKPHETVPMPVLFYIDPKIAEDETLRDIDTLTLSYTFYRSDDQNEPK
eukprot:TRINITY_DN1074_c0_g2_i2.p1 TRINITY_DN1074_c0_g2~~TRINITY_DN1074_c0_g2_i2.p1  ORF type:complete len:293 (+),score=45.34 TRINITY_DN1074_c0_g2_i2:219-1097(+)